jgi:hypothetical protein
MDTTDRLSCSATHKHRDCPVSFFSTGTFQAEHSKNHSLAEMRERYFESSFMGTGQAFAVFNLTEMLDELDIKVGLFRRQSLQASELQDQDVAFLGSRGWNGLLERIILPSVSFFIPNQHKDLGR